jgi:hypothetical protein
VWWGFLRISRDYLLQTRSSKQPIGDFSGCEIIPSDPSKYTRSKQGLTLPRFPTTHRSKSRLSIPPRSPGRPWSTPTPAVPEVHSDARHPSSPLWRPPSPWSTWTASILAVHSPTSAAHLHNDHPRSGGSGPLGTRSVGFGYFSVFLLVYGSVYMYLGFHMKIFQELFSLYELFMFVWICCTFSWIFFKRFIVTHEKSRRTFWCGSWQLTNHV